MQLTSAAVQAASSPAVPPITTYIAVFIYMFFHIHQPQEQMGLQYERIGRFTPIRFPAQPTLQEIHLRRSQFHDLWQPLFTHANLAIRLMAHTDCELRHGARIRSATFGSRTLPMEIHGLAEFFFTAFTW